MAKRYYGKNIRPFTAICDCDFGRKIITTNANDINAANVVKELNSALAIHNLNKREIDYLDRYYRGDQPILYRQKKVRPEVNNRIVQNIAFLIVETKASEIVGEPIQYVLHGSDEKKSAEIENLNVLMNSEDKEYDDIELCRWRSICGTAYRFVGEDEKHGNLLDESIFNLSVEDPRETFVCYFGSNRKKPAFSCQIRTNEDNKVVYTVYTNSVYFQICDNEIIASGINGNGAIPVIEYPNNARRLSDVEITILLTDEINKMSSDRSNGIEQFVQSWIKFINCEIDTETFHQMRDEGALVVKSNNGSENKADVDVMTSELNQTESQVAVDDLFSKLLEIQGMANREGNSGGGDTGNAVMLRNGFYLNEKRAELSEPVFKRSERMFIRLVLNRLRIDTGCTLVPSDVEIKISRSKLDNMLTKAEVLQILVGIGIDPARAIKTVGLFSDPEQTAIESIDTINKLLLAKIEPQETVVEKIESNSNGEDE